MSPIEPPEVPLLYPAITVIYDGESLTNYNGLVHNTYMI